jgi:hypothetical protein
VLVGAGGDKAETMITAALAFIHARKWLVELILAAAVIAVAWLFCQHLIEVGVQRQKDADAKEYAAMQRKADIETGRLQGVADAAEKAREKEASDLDQYRRDHPLHGGLCNKLSAAAGPEASAAHGGNADPSAATGDLLAVPPGDPGVGGQGDPDVRHLLDVLAGRADLLSAGLREYQAREK